MSDKLPPSKFGAGFTYGGDQAPAVLPPAHRPAQVGAVPQNFSGGQVGQQPPNGYAAPLAYPTPVAPAAPLAYSPPATPGAPMSYVMSGNPSGVTAIIAGVVALLMGLYRAWQAYGLFSLASAFSGYADGLSGMGRIQTYITIEAFASAGAALALIVGAILLLTRKSAGRGFIIVGCLIVIAETFVTWAAIYGWFNDFFSALGEGVGGLRGPGYLVLAVGVSTVVPLLVMILALTGATRRWCEAGRQTYAAPVTY